MATRALVRIPVPGGPAGVAALWQALPGALGDDGPAIAPIPVRSATVSDDYIGMLLNAARPGVPLEDPTTAVVLTTSGSTGAPKGVELSASAVRASAESAARWFGVELSGTAWVAAIPVTSSGGFNVVARAWLSGQPPVALPSIGGAAPYDPRAWITAVDEMRGRAPDAFMCTSIVPTMLHRAVDDAAVLDALRAFDAILVGGARLDAVLHDRAQAEGLQIVRTYGMTETCGGCVFDGQPLADVRLRVDSHAQIQISGPMLMSRYRLDPAATAARLVDGWLATGDLGGVTGGVLAVTGRADDVVQVKGTSVSVLAVAAVASATADIVECEVVAVPAGADGHRLIAFVVGEAADSVIESRVRAALGQAAVPSVRRLTALPRLPNGKCDRTALARMAQERTEG